ncbi:MAG TPA: hypothetical protein EYP41_22910 [Anaerolineae bacterium]|nr:hypothetical protein [Anaerolineae bacterium]
MQLSQTLGHAQIQAWTHLNLGRLALCQEQLAAARNSFASTQSLAGEHHMPLLAGHALAGLGQTALAQGDPAAAQRDLTAALTIFAEVDAGAAALTRAHLSRVFLALEEPDASLAYSTEAVTAVAAAQGSFIERQQAYLYHYQALTVCGQPQEAWRWLEKGRAMLLVQAAALSDEWRESLLTAVPVNREIMALSGA